MSLEELVKRIETLNRNLARFWKKAHGWAPIEAAGLLSKSRLDWQASLSSCLRLWLREPSGCLSDGELILAWTNLGSLIEGTLKLFLSVYHNDFYKDIDGQKAAGAFDHQKKIPKSPDGLTLDRLKKYFVSKGLIKIHDAELVQLVQNRRNAIHAFKDNPIGDETELWQAVRDYLALLRDINARLPYPDDMYVPRET